MPRRTAVVAAVPATALAVVAWLSAVGVEPFAIVLDAPFSVGFAGVVASGVAIAVLWSAALDAAAPAAGLAVVITAWLATGLQVLDRLGPIETAALSAAGSLGVLGAAAMAGRSVAIAVALPATVSFGAHVWGYQPFADPACLAPCPEVSAPLADAWGARLALGVAVATELVALLVLGGFAIRSDGPRPVRFAAVLVAGGFAAADAIPWCRWGKLDSTLAPDRIRTMAAMVAVVVVSTVVLRRRRARRGLERFIRQLGSGGSMSLRGVRAVHFAVPGGCRWVDAHGWDVVAEDPDAFVLPGADGSSSIRLIASAHSADEVASAITPAIRLALDNARLTVIARVRVADLSASQARIVAVADAERHRIERDLHDGAQQRLVGATMHLAAAAARLSGPARDAARAAGELVHIALAGLREISHGTLLAVLNTEGLAAALEDLCHATGVPLQAGALPELTASVERAAYDLVAAGVAGGGTRVWVGVANDRVVVSVAGPSPSAALNAAADRASATGGTIRYDNVGVSGEWPCGSW